MSGKAQRDPRDRGAGLETPAPGERQRQRDENPGWAIVSYLIAGMALYGGIGWVIGRWTGSTALPLVIGMLVGLALALALVIFRYGRS
jgi:F0F1-type ATP synthase assembly protein I